MIVSIVIKLYTTLVIHTLNMTVLTFGVASTIAVTGNVAPFAAPALAGTLTGYIIY